MRAFVHTRTVFAGLVTAALMTGVALADEAKPRFGFGPMMQHWGSGMMFGRNAEGMREYMQDYLVDRIDGRLAFIKTELKITQAQDSVWQDFATTLRDTAESHNAQMQEMMGRYFGDDKEAASLPAWLDFQEAHFAQRLEETQRLRAAVDALYAVLDEEQKKAAAEIVMPLMGGMGMMGSNGMMGYGPGMRGNWR